MKEVNSNILTYFKNIFLFWLLLATILFSPCDITGQSPYRLNGLGDGIFSGASIGLLTFGRAKYKKIQPLTMEEINKLSRKTQRTQSYY